MSAIDNNLTNILIKCNNVKAILTSGEEVYIGRLGKSDLTPSMSMYGVYVKIIPSGRIIPLNTDLRTALQISRYHLRISFQGNLILIEDCGMDDWLSKKRGTKTGTFINGKRIVQETFDLNDFRGVKVSLGNVLDVHIVPIRGITDEREIVIKIISKMSDIVEICSVGEVIRLNDLLTHYRVIEEYITLFKDIKSVNNFIELIKKIELYYKNSKFDNPIITDKDLIESVRMAAKEVIERLRSLR